MVENNVQVLMDGVHAAGAAYPLPVSMPATAIKGAPITLFGGAIAASVAETAATVIDMSGYEGGSLEVIINSGTGTFSCALMTKAIATGVFVAGHKEKQDGSGMEARPAIVTTASTSLSYSISGLRSKYLKIVPTLTGTANATFKFTPTVN